jgi:predicted RNA-binding Zn-ribbon protein involved in translation (DUF1610 family)
MKTPENQLRRLEAAAVAEKKSFARELAAGLQLLRFRGTCKCGLMLTNRDQNEAKESQEATYNCPHCGRSGLLAKLVAT